MKEVHSKNLLKMLNKLKNSKIYLVLVANLRVL